MKSVCCINCSDKNTGCHSTCIKYMAEVLARDSEKQRIREIEKTERAFNDYRANVYNNKKVK